MFVKISQNSQENACFIISSSISIIINLTLFQFGIKNHSSYLQ